MHGSRFLPSSPFKLTTQWGVLGEWCSENMVEGGGLNCGKKYVFTGYDRRGCGRLVWGGDWVGERLVPGVEKGWELIFCYEKREIPDCVWGVSLFYLILKWNTEHVN